jgi:leukotriene-A4 hydrolase
MENPLLTFASPTMIVGDKSEVNVAIHEIAHSWTGNLVSCKNWENFWLNEGFTVYLERKGKFNSNLKIKGLKALYGEDVYELARYSGNLTLLDAVNNFGFVI